MSSYKLLNIILLESQFKREPEIDFSDPGFNHELDVNIETHKDVKNLFVTLTLDFTAGKDDEKKIASKVRMVGIFEMPESEGIEIEYFGNVNAPAIIFPFIREHLASVSMKAGVNPILLPPINFVKLAEENKVLSK